MDDDYVIVDFVARGDSSNQWNLVLVEVNFDSFH